MELDNNTLSEIYNAALMAAQKASVVIAGYDYKSIKVDNKEGGDTLASQVVTEVDLKAQEIILDSLKEISQKYNLGLLTEELPDDGSRFEKEYFWCIDPLDGTLPFTEGTPGYSVSIGLVAKSGDPVIGVIADPVYDVIYSAAKGMGAFRDGEVWKFEPDGYSKDRPLTLVCDRSFFEIPQFEDSMKKLEEVSAKLGLNGTAMIHQGGGAMNAMWIIENTPACYFKFPKATKGCGSLWDYAASTCIFNELGAYATGMNGVPLDLNSSESTFVNKSGILFANSKKVADVVLDIYSEYIRG